MGFFGLFRKKIDIPALQKKNIDLKKEVERLKTDIESLKTEHLSLLRRVEAITRNLVDNYNPTTVVEATGQSLVDLLKETNHSNRGILNDMTTFNKDLQIRLDAAREKIDALHGFLIVAGKKIGFFEGVLRGGTRVEVSRDEVQPLIAAYGHYETALMKQMPSQQ